MTCTHPKRVRNMGIEQGTPAVLTLWAETCLVCSVTLLHQLKQTIEVYPDGTQVVVPHDPETGDIDGGARLHGGPDIDTVNSLIGGDCE